MPYDFRLTPELMETRDGYFSSFKARVETQVQRRGQRAVIYGHSMGCKVSAYFFSWLGSQFPTESQRLKWIDDHVGMYRPSRPRDASEAGRGDAAAATWIVL